MPGKKGEFGSKADCGASKAGGEAAKRNPRSADSQAGYPPAEAAIAAFQQARPEVTVRR